MKRFLLFLSSILFAGFLATGCGTMTQTCTGPNCTRAEAFATISEMRAQTTLLVNAGKINSTQAEKIQTDLRTAEVAANASTGITGDDQLAKARSVLATVRTTLVAYGATLK